MKLTPHVKKTSKVNIIFAILIGLLILILGFVIGIIINNIGLLRITSEIRLLEIIDLFLMITVPLTISLIITSWYDKNKFIKTHLIDETKICLEHLKIIKDFIDLKFTEKSQFNQNDTTKINLCFKNLNQKLNCLRTQLDLSYKKKSEEIRKGIIEKYTDYWKVVTDSSIYKKNYIMDDTFYWSTVRRYNESEIYFKRLIHIINQF
jgi:hypothetical protein